MAPTRTPSPSAAAFAPTRKPLARHIRALTGASVSAAVMLVQPAVAQDRRELVAHETTHERDDVSLSRERLES